MNLSFRKPNSAVARCALAAVVVAGAAATTTGANAQLIPGPTVTIDSTYGKITGMYTVDLGAQMYRGIPYAAAPTGALRWRSPAAWSPTPAWTGKASAFGASCPQSLQTNTETLNSGQSEDCLFLNVARPNNATTGLPVMVYIHGGGFDVGSGNLYMQDPVLAERGVVLVTLNYRLGVLGFLAAPAIDMPGERSSGDFGLEDQRAAIAWVHDHISSFGGDPSNVTIFGESAGGFSVCDQIVMEAQNHTTYFQKAIVESGACELPLPTTATAAVLGNTLLNLMAPNGATIAPGATVASALQQVPPGELVSIGTNNTVQLAGSAGKITNDPNFLLPRVGGTILPTQPGQLFASGTSLPQIAVLMGDNRDEENVVMADDPNWPNNTSVNSIVRIRAIAGGAGNAAAALYGTSLGTADLPTYYRALTDWGGVVGGCPELKTYQDARSSMSAVYVYEFQDENNVAADIGNAAGVVIDASDVLTALFKGNLGPLVNAGTSVPAPLGALHGAEVPYWAASTYVSLLFGTAEATLANTITNAWAAFAKSGNPGWSTFDGTDAHVFDSNPSAPPTVNLSSEHHCDFWLQTAADAGAYPDAGWLTE